jgi:hypothetical protein
VKLTDAPDAIEAPSQGSAQPLPKPAYVQELQQLTLFNL